MQNKNKIRNSRSDVVFYAISYFLLAIFMFIVIYPLYFVVIASISDPSEVVLGKITFWPKGVNFDGYKRVFQNQNILMGYGNTIIYTFLGTLVNLIGTLTAGFVFSRPNLKGSRICMLLILFTMYFGGGLIPTYFNMRDLHLLNTIWVLIIPGAISSYNMIIARTFIRSTIPEALYEAASIDGCSQIRYYLQIVLPLSGALLGVLTLYSVVGYWNSYYDAMIYLTDRKKYPLQLILREILVQSQVTKDDLGNLDALADRNAYLDMVESLKYALIIVASVPMLVLYPFLQCFFNKGVMIGSIKG